MAEHIGGVCTPLRRSQRLGKGALLAITEELGPLKETEDELRAVKAEEEEEKHGDEETGLGLTAAPLERGQVPHGEVGVTAAPLESGQEPHVGEVVVTAAPLERGQVPHGGEVVVTAAPLERGQVPHGGEVVVTAAPLERGQVPHGGEVVVTAAPLERGQAPHGGEVVLANEEEDTVQAEVGTIQLPAPPMCVPAASEHFEEKKTHLESATEPCKRPLLGAKEPKVKSASLSGKREVAVPKGKPKSGRVWKDQNKKRFSGMVKDRPLHTSWDKKMAARREKSLMKDYSQRLKDEKQKAKEEKKQRREENLKRRLENERKAEVVQVITNLAKLKRAKKKQLRRIEKRDTLALVQRGSGINKKAERLENFLKKKRETTEAKENTN